MRSYSKYIESPYDTKSYDDIKNTYLWVVKIYRVLGISESDVSCRFLFTLDGIQCSPESYEKFTEDAFGRDNINFSRASFSCLKVSEKYYISLTNNSNSGRGTIRISGSNKNAISKFEDAIGKIASNTQANNSIQIDNKIQVDIKDAEKDSKTPNFWRPILQNVISNAIWWIVGLLFVTFVGITVFNQHSDSTYNQEYRNEVSLDY